MLNDHIDHVDDVKVDTTPSRKLIFNSFLQIPILVLLAPVLLSGIERETERNRERQRETESAGGKTLFNLIINFNLENRKGDEKRSVTSLFPFLF